jgi:hypothetical protein
MLRLSQEQAQAFYEVHKERPLARRGCGLLAEANPLTPVPPAVARTTGPRRHGGDRLYEDAP